MKILDCKHEIPNPVTFPVDVQDIKKCPEYPNAIISGFIIDFEVLEVDRSKLESVTLKDKEGVECNLLLAKLACKYLLSEPKYIQQADKCIIFVWLHPVTDKWMGIQCKYYNYLRNRYPGCSFYAGRCEHDNVAVKIGDEIKGTVAPFIVRHPEKIE
jgi:hypothetical protein